MKKFFIIIFVLLFILCLFFASVIVNKYSKDNINGEDFKEGYIENTEFENNETSKIAENNQNNKMVKLTNENFEEEVLKSEQTVLIDFYADWCGPCQMMSPIIEKISKENNEIKVGKINIDEEVELANKYKVMSIPTFVVIKNGKEVNRIIGAVAKSEIEAIIK